MVVPQGVQLAENIGGRLKPLILLWFLLCRDNCRVPKKNEEDKENDAEAELADMAVALYFTR